MKAVGFLLVGAVAVYVCYRKLYFCDDLQRLSALGWFAGLIASVALFGFGVNSALDCDEKHYKPNEHVAVSNFRDDASVTAFDVAIDGHAGIVRCGIQRIWDKEGGTPFVTHNCWWVTAEQLKNESLAHALSRR